MSLPTRVECIIGDITDESVDAIVNAANTSLILGSGVAGAIARKGGPSIQEFCENHGAVELGGVALTRAGDIPTKWIIHAATMHMGGKPCDDSIRRATQNALKVARDKKFDTISFPALGAGIGCHSTQIVAKIMVGETSRFLQTQDFPRLVRFVLFDRQTYSAFKEELNKLTPPL